MQTNDLETITTTFVGQVESATKYEIDAENKGAALWVTKPTTGRNPNVIGREIIKVRMPHDMFAKLKAEHDAGDIHFPQLMEIKAEVDMGGGNRANLTAISIRKHIPEPLDIPTDKIDKTTGEVLTGAAMANGLKPDAKTDIKPK
ncbi:hypothetical protein [Methylomonas sp. DH-1]|uniref:hypothetical protein n=1 Tax=Methylomonas sp. (strain DH-1) TaxID=1727196 RepID=UPI0007C93492|nr:hypothetical protein [Methylomonas sp. DH-1]ANE57483.1 hypothetical protein AYM39_21375 [Methylomonas sp. DH-1]